MNFHLLIAMILGTMALPQGVWANELAELENELTQFQESYDENEAPLPIWEQTELLQAISLLEERGCNESYTLRHSDRFVTSFNSAGEPCKTYDLGASADEALVLGEKNGA